MTQLICSGALLLGVLFVQGAAAQTPKEFKGHTGLVFNVAFSPDGKILATASFDNTVKLWDFSNGKELATLKGHTAPVYSVVFSPDGTMIATGSQDNSIRIWDKDGKFQRELKGHTGIVDSVAFGPNSDVLASGSADKSVRLWNPKEGKELKNLGSHKESVYSVAFSPNGKLLASGSNDTTVKVWDVKDQKEVKQFGTPPPDPVKDNPKDKKTKEKKDDAKKEDKDKKEEKDKKDDPKKIIDLEDRPEGITGVVFAPDNNTVMAVSFDKKLHFLNVSEGKETKRIGAPKETKDADDLFGVAVSRDGKHVATAGYGGSLRVYEIESGNLIFKRDPIKMVTYCVAFTPDGRALVTGHERDNAARVTAIDDKKK